MKLDQYYGHNWNTDKHYCQHCETTFRIDIGSDESGDFFLICPKCKWKHYRHFENGVAMHCDITKREWKHVIDVQGK